ncbi:MAG TPA: ferritin-like domain-containing protein [Verrucomicrobiae bacterium]
MENELKELFIEELADMLHAEKQLTKALPKLAKAADSDELREAFESHLEETETHISRIEQVFEMLEKPAKAKKCPAMEGLVKEGAEVIEEHKGSPAIDAALIAAAQKAEHYEIASYGTLCAWAEMLELEDAVDLLKETLDEEKAADEKLTELAESLANAKAESSE